ncbi:uncharacterized protein METZ01_LOCUS285083 [marine metagenome]|uniref:Uncharacterized protein n=1 Tax=marine metagenome TaxID=408172 RepID=A0A382L6G9_9ZZZZ
MNTPTAAVIIGVTPCSNDGDNGRQGLNYSGQEKK